MAIDRKGQVTTTGILNKPSVNVDAPDMSGLGKGVPHGGAQTPATPAKQSKQQNLQIKT